MLLLWYNKYMSKELIQDILLHGTNAEKLEVFQFNTNDIKVVYNKWRYFQAYHFSRYFQSKPSPEHERLIKCYLKAYLGIPITEDEVNFIIKGFRGSAKTALMKLTMAFVLTCDIREKPRMYNKVLSKDLKNAQQVVTDVYNMLVECRDLFGDMFEKEGDKKREERMGSFTLKNQVKFTAGTIGQTQRGHQQDAYRPDFIWFDDIEDRESIASTVVTQGIINKIEEALDGMSPDGNWVCTANYISEYGAVEHLASKDSCHEMILPIATDCVYDEQKLVDCKPTWEARFPIEKIKEIQGDSQYWYSEYLCDPTREDDKFFNLDLIDKMMQEAKEPIRVEAGLKVWADFYQGHRYDVGADVAGGGGGDSSTIATFNLTTGELIATYHNNRIAPDLFAHEIARVGNKYGGCLVAPERNSIGLSTVDTLKNIYNNIYQDRTIAVHSPTPKKTLGWHTNSKTKPDMFYKFRTAFNEGLITIYDKEVLREMKAYGFNDLETKEPLPTRHFDLLTAVVIAWAIKDYAAPSKDPIKQWDLYNNRKNKVRVNHGL